MLYAILAYHVEGVIQALSEEQDADLMDGIMQVHNRLTDEGRLGPAARLGATALAVTVRAGGLVVDGPFTETKEHLLGLYVIDCEDRDAAVQAAKDLQAANPSAVYEIRPVVLYLPGTPFPATDAGLAAVRP